MPEDVLKGRYDNKLTPPIGTLWFKSENKDIFVNHSMGDGAWTVTWRVRQFAYAAGGDPTDPDFASNGGVLYLILVHTGTIQAGWSQVAQPGAFYFSMEPKDKSILPYLQFPQTGSGLKQGDTTQYTIDFADTYQMLKNGGNESFEFHPSYVEDIYRVQSEQNGDIFSDLGACQFGIGADTIGPYATYDIHALSVFQNESLNSWPVDFEFSHSLCYGTLGGPGVGGPSESRTISLDFPHTSESQDESAK